LLSLVLKVKPFDENKKVLCPYCECYVEMEEFYSRHYYGRCLNHVPGN
jgi:hypothetical protein